MFAKMTNALDFQAKALVIRADRQRIIASNIANADTPGFSGRDINFKDAMESALAGGSTGVRPASSEGALPDGRSHSRPIAMNTLQDSALGPKMDYTAQSQPAMDGNSVDLDRERANFVDNSVRYEATLRFINGTSRTILSAIQGQ